MEPYVMWLVERTDNHEEVLLSDDDVEEFTETLLAQGVDMWVREVTIH